MSLKSKKALETVHDLKALIFCWDDGNGLSVMVGKGSLSQSLEIGKIRFDFMEGDLSDFHGFTFLVPKGGLGRESTWKKGGR